MARKASSTVTFGNDACTGMSKLPSSMKFTPACSAIVLRASLSEVPRRVEGDLLIATDFRPLGFGGVHRGKQVRFGRLIGQCRVDRRLGQSLENVRVKQTDIGLDSLAPEKQS